MDKTTDLSKPQEKLFFDYSDFPLQILRRFPQKSFPFHSHDFSELVIIFSGQAVHITDKNEYSIMSGDVFLVQKNVAHGYKDLKDLNLVNILFDSEALHIPLADISLIPGYHALFTLEPHFRMKQNFMSRLRLSPHQIEFVTVLIEKIESEILKKIAGYKFLSTSLFMELLVFLARTYDSEIDKAPPEKESLYRIANTLSYLEKNYFKKITIEDMKNIALMSESTLNRTFKMSTGFSPVDYLIKLKIRKACELLRKTSFDITEIAFKVGFEDSNYFTRQFKKIMKIPPKEYRKICKVFLKNKPNF